MSGGRGPGRRGAPPLEGARLCCFLAVWLWQAVGFFLNFHLFCFYFWLCWICVSARGLSLVAVSWGPRSNFGVRASRCSGFSCEATRQGSRRVGAVVVARGVGLAAPRRVGSSQTRKDANPSPAMAGGFLTTGAPGESLDFLSLCVLFRVFRPLTSQPYHKD